MARQSPGDVAPPTFGFFLPLQACRGEGPPEECLPLESSSSLEARWRALEQVICKGNTVVFHAHAAFMPLIHRQCRMAQTFLPTEGTVFDPKVRKRQPRVFSALDAPSGPWPSCRALPLPTVCHSFLSLRFGGVPGTAQVAAWMLSSENSASPTSYDFESLVRRYCSPQVQALLHAPTDVTGLGPGTVVLCKLQRHMQAAFHLAEALLDQLDQRGMRQAAQEVEMPAIMSISSMEVLGVNFRCAGAHIEESLAGRVLPVF